MYPFIYWGSVAIPVYTLAVSLIFSGGVFYLLNRAQKFHRNRNTAIDLGLAVMIFGLLGARFMHIAYEEPLYYYGKPIEIFKVWQGGFVFYGGLLAAWLAGVFYLKSKNEPLMVWHDIFAPLVCLGYSLGRLACLASGCCYGKPTDMPWGMVFPKGVEAPAGVSLHPTQLYASIWEFCLFLLLVFLEPRLKKYQWAPGSLFGIWLTLHAVGRLFMEYYRMDSRGATHLGLSISSLISFALIGFGVLLLALLNRSRNKIAKS